MRLVQYHLRPPLLPPPPQSAQAAIAALNDTDLMGRLIFVREDRESTTTFRGGLNPEPYTLNPTPHTLNPTPHTLNPSPCTLSESAGFKV